MSSSSRVLKASISREDSDLPANERQQAFFRRSGSVWGFLFLRLGARFLFRLFRVVFSRTISALARARRPRSRIFPG